MSNEMKFEDALKKLEQIVESLENGELSLDTSIELFQKGMDLSNFCSKQLDNAEKKINILIKNKNGQLEEIPFNTEED